MQEQKKEYKDFSLPPHPQLRNHEAGHNIMQA